MYEEGPFGSYIQSDHALRQMTAEIEEASTASRKLRRRMVVFITIIGFLLLFLLSQAIEGEDHQKKAVAHFNEIGLKVIDRVDSTRSRMRRFFTPQQEEAENVGHPPPALDSLPVENRKPATIS